MDPRETEFLEARAAAGFPPATEGERTGTPGRDGGAVAAEEPRGLPAPLVIRPGLRHRLRRLRLRLPAERRRMGANAREGGVEFAVWAPRAQMVGVAIDGRCSPPMG